MTKRVMHTVLAILSAMLFASIVSEGASAPIVGIAALVVFAFGLMAVSA